MSVYTWDICNIRHRKDHRREGRKTVRTRGQEGWWETVLCYMETMGSRILIFLRVQPYFFLTLRAPRGRLYVLEWF